MSIKYYFLECIYYMTFFLPPANLLLPDLFLAFSGSLSRSTGTKKEELGKDKMHRNASAKMHRKANLSELHSCLLLPRSSSLVKLVINHSPKPTAVLQGSTEGGESKDNGGGIDWILIAAKQSGLTKTIHAPFSCLHRRSAVKQGWKWWG